MDFFSKENLDKARQEISIVGSELAKRTKDMAEHTGLHTQVLTEEARIREQYRIIGQIFYEECKDNAEQMELLSDAYREAFEKIAVSQWKIDNAKESIAKKKGAVCCLNCGNNVPKTAQFCSKCGKKMKTN